ncbi:MAG: DNA mismatch repair protein MutS [Clostridiaceae bacterium]
MEKNDEFKKRLDSFKKLEDQKRQQANRLSNLRLLAFLLGAAVSILLFIKAGLFYGFTVLPIALIAFLYLIVKHNRISREQKKLNCMADINKRYIDRMNSDWVNFSDCGQEFVNASHPYTGDLDILGPKSLFQWINAANTYYGRKILCELLKNPDKNTYAIEKRQKAVKELSKKLDFCQELQCEGMLATDAANDPESMLSYTEDKLKRFKNDWVINLFYILPASVILTFTLYFLGSRIPVFVPLLLLCIQMSVCAVGYRRNIEIIGTVSGLKKYLDTFSSLLQRIEQEEFTDEYLSGLRQEFFTNNSPASASIKQLEKIANAIDIRFSTVLYFILNFGLLWDYHCVFALEDWKRLYGGQIRKWLETVGQIEAISSLAVIGHMYPEWVFPIFSEKDLKFLAKKMGHPLIPENKCVCNDFEINKGTCVITGSNMSGKTTLLRTVGINLVLAYSGAPVFAQKMECSVMDIFTSMRVRDDLNSGISTFYAELLRIKMMIEYSKKEQPMIYMIDEIFMGTNSLDRITGARSVLKNLNKSWIIGLISTHDFELCDLEKESQENIKNYHFTEQYINNEIKFDYMLRPGRSRTTNARYLMKMVGIEF